MDSSEMRELADGCEDNDPTTAMWLRRLADIVDEPDDLPA